MKNSNVPYGLNKDSIYDQLSQSELIKVVPRIVFAEIYTEVDVILEWPDCHLAVMCMKIIFIMLKAMKQQVKHVRKTLFWLMTDSVKMKLRWSS